MKSNGFLYLIIAGMLAIIGFLIYFFFFNKKSQIKNNGVSDSVNGNVPNTATNPISSQTMDKPVYTPPVLNFPTGDTSVSSGVFENNQYEVLKTDGNALTERSNNPGAIFWDGSTPWQGLNKKLTKSGQIIYFDTVDYGVRAQCMTLKNYSKKHGIYTLNSLTARYAPLGHGNNNPIAYAQTLAAYLGIEPTDKFDLNADRNLLAGVAYFIHRVEAGYFWVNRDKFIEWAAKV